MNDLRLVLLVLGVLLVGGIWFLGVFARRRSNSSRAAPERTAPPPPGRPAGAFRAGVDEPPMSSLTLDLADEDTGPGLPPLGLEPVAGVDGAAEVSRRGSSPPPGTGGEDEAREAPGPVLPAAPLPGDPRIGLTPDPLRAGVPEGFRATREDPMQLELGGLGRGATDSPPETGQGERHDASDEDEPEPETLVVVLTVLARKGRYLAGDALRGALEAHGLRYGEGRIFHCYASGQPLGAGPLFSAVNIVEPGVFDPDTIDSMRTPGVGLFMRLPGPKDPAEAFAKMVETARRLADALDAQVCDETRSSLTAQALNHLREQIADYGRRRLLRV